MTEKPDIPEWAMRAATDALNIDVWYEDGRSLLQESVALAIIQARSQAFEELEAKLTAKKYLPSQGIDAEMEAYNDGLDEAISIISGLKNG